MVRYGIILGQLIVFVVVIQKLMSAYAYRVLQMTTGKGRVEKIYPQSLNI